MRLLALWAACMACSASGLLAADLMSGTWIVGDGLAARVYVFRVSGDRITGITCGPCDDPDSVFRVEDGRLVDEDHAVFFIRSNIGATGSRDRDRFEASLFRDGMKLAVRPESGPTSFAMSTSLIRVVEKFELDPRPLPPPPPKSGKAPVRKIDGHWVSVGRTAQQNWILNVENGEVWGLVCGPCTPAVVTMIDGYVDGDRVLFYVNHIDTPPSRTRKGIQRNVMTATIGAGDNSNLMNFTWVGEGTGSTGQITMIRPVR